MKFDDLHPWFRWRLRKERHNFTAERFRELEKVWGPLRKRELPLLIYASILTGVAFVVVIAAFNLWRYFAILFALLLGVTEFIFWLLSQPRD